MGKKQGKRRKKEETFKHFYFVSEIGFKIIINNFHFESLNPWEKKS